MAGADLHGITPRGGRVRVTGTGSDVVTTTGNLPGAVVDGDEAWSEFVDGSKEERRFNAVAMVGTGAGLRPVPLS